jgi:hypothetical protein
LNIALQSILKVTGKQSSFSSVATLVPTIGIYEVKREKNKVFSFSFIQATELRREGAVTEEEKFLDFYRIFMSFLNIIQLFS